MSYTKEELAEQEFEAFKGALKNLLPEEKFNKLTRGNIENILDSYKRSHNPWIGVNHQNRNSKCECGSGKKYKHCCVNVKSKYKLDIK